MALDFNQEMEFEKLKQKNKIELAELNHKHMMEELEKQIEKAKIESGRDVQMKTESQVNMFT